ncbi:MAG TPA: hypothetical protein VMV86_01895 [Methanosarcinales archaeon]|nr:hypothetical protein [Methanosarcinales archaeon]
MMNIEKLNELKKQRKSNKAFMIANGGSIALAKQNLSKLKDCDTIACNGWYPHGKKVFNFDPTYFCVADCNTFRKNRAFWDNFSDYSKTNCIFSLANQEEEDFYKYFEKKDVTLIGENNIVAGFAYDGGDKPKKLIKSDKVWDIRRGFFRRLGIRQDITSLMVMVLLWMGYKEIYVVGVDYQDKYTGYFWDLNRTAFRTGKKLRGVYSTWSTLKARANRVGSEIYMCNTKKYNKLDQFVRVSFEEAVCKK